MKKIILFFALIIVFTAVIFAQTSPKTTNTAFDAMLNNMLSMSVPILTSEQLYTRIYTQKETFTLLDARETNEYKVSHLPNAINVGYDKFDIKTVQNLPKKTPILIYCSVGYRSERIGERLQKAGFSQVYNLYGGIFDWANRKFPLLDAREKTTLKVHPYSKTWGLWLKS